MLSLCEGSLGAAVERVCSSAYAVVREISARANLSRSRHPQTLKIESTNRVHAV